MRHFDMSGDVIEALPPRAAEKLQALREAAEEMHGAYTAVQDQIQPAQAEFYKAEEWHRACKDKNTGARPLEDGSPSPLLKAAEERLETARARFERAMERRDTMGARYQSLGHTVGIVEKYVREMIGEADLIEILVDTPELRRGETYVQAVERARKVIAGQKADLHAARSAPLHSEDVKAAVRNKLETLAKRPSLFGAIERGLPIEWPTTRVTGELIAVARLPNGKGGISEGGVTGSAASNPIDALGLMAWLFRDRLAEALESEIDEHADDRNALRADERAAKIAEALSARLEAERLEESLIESAAAVGQEIPRRADADPRAVLGIDGPAPKERT